MIILGGNKYKFHTLHVETGGITHAYLVCERYGEPWRNFIGDKAIRALYDFALEQERLRMQYECYIARLEEAIKCSCGESVDKPECHSEPTRICEGCKLAPRCEEEV